MAVAADPVAFMAGVVGICAVVVGGTWRLSRKITRLEVQGKATRKEVRILRRIQGDLISQMGHVRACLNCVASGQPLPAADDYGHVSTVRLRRRDDPDLEEDEEE